MDAGKPMLPVVTKIFTFPLGTIINDVDVTFSEVLSSHNVRTGFIVDTYHHFKPDYNFHRGFDSWEWVRGQETDRWKSGPRDKFDPKKHMPAHLWNERYDDNIEILARLADDTGVAARQGKLLASAFHPELTADLRFHQYFLDIVAGNC